MAFRGKLSDRAFMFVAAALLCVIAGVLVGRSPLVDKLVGGGSPAKHAVHSSAAGVQVHGLWTIRVYDGSRLVTTRQFENACITVSTVGNGCDVVLADLLTRSYAMGPWQLYANNAGGGQLFQLSSAADIGSQGVQGPLTVSGATPGHVILSGNYTATSAISIAKVSTSVSLCPSSTAPSSCVNYFGDFFFVFTAATLASPVAVANGQIVQVKVDISFS